MSRRRDTRTYPDWLQKKVDEVGEDPGRWLDRKGLQIGHGGVKEAKFFALKRIAGIDQMDVLTTWMSVESHLCRGPDENPRPWVMKKLRARRQQLAEHGERTYMYWTEAELREAAQKRYEDSEKGEVIWSDRDGGTRSSTYRRGTSLVADGGESE